MVWNLKIRCQQSWLKVNKLPKVTYDLDPANLVHEERRDDVAWQNSQTAQEANQVNQNVILLKCVQVAAMFVVLEGGVLHLTVDEPVLPQVYREQEGNQT